MRYVLSIFIGIGVAITIINLMESASPLLWPQPHGIDFSNRDAVAAAIAQMPLAAKWWLVAGYAVGGLAGSFLARKVIGGQNIRPSVIVGVMLVVAGVLNNVQVPHPAWLAAASIIAPIVAVAVGAKLAESKPSRAVAHRASP